MVMSHSILEKVSKTFNTQKNDLLLKSVAQRPDLSEKLNTVLKCGHAWEHSGVLEIFHM